MSDYRFDWDEKKAISNLRKHGVSFEEAKTVFYDDNAVEFFDNQHGRIEDRFLLLGYALTGKMLMICHCIRSHGNVVRIISARKATKNEQTFYYKRS